MISIQIVILCSLLCLASCITTIRDDETGTLQSKEGDWGTWSSAVFCDAGAFARGIKLRVESQESGEKGQDDTAANAFRLICSDDESGTLAANNEEDWGKWSDSELCPDGSYITGFKTKVEEDQGSEDDTALNSVKVRCSDECNTVLLPSRWGAWGSWGSWDSCDARQSVCGFQQKVEEWSAGNDDTSLNAIRLICCENPKVLSTPVGYWELVSAVGGGGSQTYSVEYGVTEHEEYELTTAFGVSVTATASAGMFFKSASDYELSVTVSASIASRSLQSVSTHAIAKGEYTCEDGDVSLYQWITEMSEDAMTESFPFFIKSLQFWCVSDDSLTPQCPFGYCADDDCQVCDDEWDEGSTTVEDLETDTETNVATECSDEPDAGYSFSFPVWFSLYVAVFCAMSLLDVSTL